MPDTFARMRQLVGTSAEWAANDLIIGLGEFAIELVGPLNSRLKLGDGVNRYSALPYYDPGIFDFVEKAGDEMTGPLIVPDLTVTTASSVPLMPTGDVSDNIASCAWVKNLLLARGQGEAVYAYGGNVVAGDPGAGKFILDPATDPVRQFAASTTDADGIGRYLLLMQPGDSIIITNEFTPVTAYARYDLVSNIVDHGTWAEGTVHLIDSSAFAEAPPLNTRLKITGYLNLATGDGPILGVVAGTGLTGGGNVGIVTLAADPLVLASQADLKARLPAGSLIDFAGSVVPAGWYACDGSLKVRATDADLFAAISTAFNTGGEAGTDFRLPDCRGRYTAGADPTNLRLGGSAARNGGFPTTGPIVLGQVAGEQSHTLTTAEQTNDGHLYYNPSAQGPATSYSGGANPLWYAVLGFGGGSHNNIPPTIVFPKIIKR